jgi:hypothetical protein
VVEEDLGEHQQMLNQVVLVVVVVKELHLQMLGPQELLVKDILEVLEDQQHQHLAAEVVLEVLAQHQWLVVRD